MPYCQMKRRVRDENFSEFEAREKSAPVTNHRASFAAVSLLFAGVVACSEASPADDGDNSGGGTTAASGGNSIGSGGNSIGSGGNSVGSGGSAAGGGSGGLSNTGGSTAAGGISGGTGGSVATGGAATGGGGNSGSGGSTDGSGGNAPTGTPVDRYGQLQVSGGGLADEQGSPVQLKGASSMWLNWDGADYATNREGLQFMRDEWGLEVFRIAMGITPEDAYLEDPDTNEAKVRTIVDNAIELGVYVIIDWHDHEAESHQSEAEAFFASMADAYGDTPNVLYEVYNEPTESSWSGDLKPYHEALVATIRQRDPDNLIILGTPNWSQYVDVAAQDPVAGSNLLYTLHFYSCSHTGWLRDAGDAALQAGLALFVTEWGATDADGGTPENPGVCEAEAQAWHDWMNQNGISWTAWKLDGCNDSSCYFVDRDVSPAGGWTESDLNGHAPFVIEKMRE